MAEILTQQSYDILSFMNPPQAGCWECYVQVSPENAELCAQALLDAGCAGVWIQDSDFVDDGENATLKTRKKATVVGYLTQSGVTEDACHQKVQTALREYNINNDLQQDLECKWAPAQNWAKNWRENFPPLEAGPFLVTAPWHTVDASNTINICIDPGLAFGTGQHPTTELCLKLLAKHYKSTFPADALDVGCGSGILSIALAILAAKEKRAVNIIASDLDPWCTTATTENAERNGVHFKVMEAAGLDWCESTFDLVLANLMSDILISLATDLARVTRVGGTLIVSGISLPRANDVTTTLHNAGFIVREKHQGKIERPNGDTEQWVAMVLERSA